MKQLCETKLFQTRNEKIIFFFPFFDVLVIGAPIETRSCFIGHIWSVNEPTLSGSSLVGRKVWKIKGSKFESKARFKFNEVMFFIFQWNYINKIKCYWLWKTFEHNTFTKLIKIWSLSWFSFKSKPTHQHLHFFTAKIPLCVISKTSHSFFDVLHVKCVETHLVTTLIMA